MVLWDGLRGPIAARRQTVLPRSLCVTVPGAALLLYLELKSRKSTRVPLEGQISNF